MHWLKISCILCLYGCFKDFRPSESFITDYLTGPWKNFTSEEVNQDIYPVSTYSYATTLILVFLITDFVRYKPIIILCSVSGAITFLLIIFEKTLIIMQIMEFFYGLCMSAEVAYYTYIYAKVEKKHYQEVTGYTKAASLFGRSMSGVVAQLTASFNLLDYHQLNYITLSAYITATIWAFFLPSVDQSVYFHRNNLANDENSATEETKEKIEQSQRFNWRYLCCCGRSTCNYKKNKNNVNSLFYKIVRAYSLLWKHFVQAFTNYSVIKWSIWWALGTCGYLQVANNMQLLWQTAVQPTDKIYNGAVDFLYAILSAITVFYVGKIQLNWVLIGDIMLFLLSCLEGCLLLSSSYSDNIWVLYIIYIIFGIIYHTIVTVTSFEVAKSICEDSYGLIFGMNMFFGLVAQSLLSMIVFKIFKLDIRPQFFVYGCYFLVLALVYLVNAIINIVQHKRNGKSFHLWDIDTSLPTSTQNVNGDVITRSEFEINSC